MVVQLNSDDELRVFTCPSCGTKFRAGMGKEARAYKCPSCKNPLTIRPDGTVEKGDQVHPKLTIEQMSETLQTRKTNVPLPRPRPEMARKTSLDSDDEEKKLYKEILEEFNTLNKQRKTIEELDAKTIEIRTLRMENERLIKELRALKETEMKKKPIAHTPGKGEDAQKEIKTLISELEAKTKLAEELMAQRDRFSEDLDATRKALEDLSGKTKDSSSMTVLELQNKLEARMEELEEEKQKNESHRRELDEYRSALEEKAVEVAREKDAVERMKELLAVEEARTKDLIAKEKKLAETEKKLMEDRKEIEKMLSRTKQTDEMISNINERTLALKEKEETLSRRESELERMESGSEKRKEDLSEMEQLLQRKEDELSRKEVVLQEQERSIAKGQEALMKARAKLKELKDKMEQELIGARLGQKAKEAQEGIRERIESKEEGIKEMEHKIKDMLA